MPQPMLFVDAVHAVLVDAVLVDAVHVYDLHCIVFGTQHKKNIHFERIGSLQIPKYICRWIRR